MSSIIFICKDLGFKGSIERALMGWEDIWHPD